MSKKKNSSILRKDEDPTTVDFETWDETTELRSYGPFGKFLEDYDAYPSSYITQIVRDVIVYEDNLKEVVSYHKEQNEGNPNARNVQIVTRKDDAGKDFAAVQIGELIIRTPREVYTISRENENGSPVIEIHDKNPDEKKRGIDAVRIYDFLGRKFLEEAANHYYIRQYVTDFDVSELVDAGIYGRTSDAVIGLKSAMDFLSLYTLAGAYEKKEKGKWKSRIITGGNTQLFQNYFFYKDPDDGRRTMVEVERMESFPWDDTTEQFQMPEPKWIFEISDAPYLLVHEIFNRARRNAGKTNKPDRRLNFRAARYIMKLPSPDRGQGKKKPKEEIKTPIMEAVATIQATFKLHKYHGIEIEPRFDDGYNFDSPISDFLDHGYIYILERGEYKEAMRAIHSKRGKYLTNRHPKSPKGLSGKTPNCSQNPTKTD